MRYLIYFLTGILLISLQTTLVHALAPFIFFYDLMIPFVVFFILFRGGGEGLIASVFVGCAMDTLSGAPFGVYVFSYLWLVLLFKNVKPYLQISDSTLFQVVVVCGVFIELTIFGVVYALSAPSFYFSRSIIWMMFTQLFSAMIFGPFVFVLFQKGFGLMENLIDEKPGPRRFS